MHDPAPCRVELTESCGEWFVRVEADGRQTVTGFDLESFARSYAEGQRIRLGLQRVEWRPADAA